MRPNLIGKHFPAEPTVVRFLFFLCPPRDSKVCEHLLCGNEKLFLLLLGKPADFFELSDGFVELLALGFYRRFVKAKEGHFIKNLCTERCCTDLFHIAGFYLVAKDLVPRRQHKRITLWSCLAMSEPVSLFLIQRIDLRQIFQLGKLRFRFKFRMERFSGIQARIQELAVIVKMIDPDQQMPSFTRLNVAKSHDEFRDPLHGRFSAFLFKTESVEKRLSNVFCGLTYNQIFYIHY